jgi:DNA repair exonuclease SbcCD ATPase subunit
MLTEKMLKKLVEAVAKLTAGLPLPQDVQHAYKLWQAQRSQMLDMIYSSKIESVDYEGARKLLGGLYFYLQAFKVARGKQWALTVDLLMEAQAIFRSQGVFRGDILGVLSSGYGMIVESNRYAFSPEQWMKICSALEAAGNEAQRKKDIELAVIKRLRPTAVITKGTLDELEHQKTRRQNFASFYGSEIQKHFGAKAGTDETAARLLITIAAWQEGRTLKEHEALAQEKREALELRKKQREEIQKQVSSTSVMMGGVSGTVDVQRQQLDLICQTRVREIGGKQQPLRNGLEKLVNSVQELQTHFQLGERVQVLQDLRNRVDSQIEDWKSKCEEFSALNQKVLSLNSQAEDSLKGELKQVKENFERAKKEEQEQLRKVQLELFGFQLELQSPTTPSQRKKFVPGFIGDKQAEIKRLKSSLDELERKSGTTVSELEKQIQDMPNQKERLVKDMEDALTAILALGTEIESLGEKAVKITEECLLTAYDQFNRRLHQLQAGIKQVSEVSTQIDTLLSQAEDEEVQRSFKRMFEIYQNILSEQKTVLENLLTFSAKASDQADQVVGNLMTLHQKAEESYQAVQQVSGATVALHTQLQDYLEALGRYKQASQQVQALNRGPTVPKEVNEVNKTITEVVRKAQDQAVQEYNKHRLWFSRPKSAKTLVTKQPEKRGRLGRWLCDNTGKFGELLEKFLYSGMDKRNEAVKMQKSCLRLGKWFMQRLQSLSVCMD